jgi:hypothetical protein
MTQEKKPKVNSAGQAELEKVEAQFEQFDTEIKSMTMERTNLAPKQETENQTKMSSKEIHDSKHLYLKPKTTLGCKEPFNEKFRKEYEFSKEYVLFIAENKEVIGDSIECWTRPFPGIPAEEWLVPTNRPIWGPRYLAEQIKRKSYHRFVMKDNVVTAQDSQGKYYGQMAVDTTIQRLDAYPVSTKKSIFMGA